MKLDKMEKVRLIELGGTMIASSILMKAGYSNDVTQFICSLPYCVDLATSFKREVKTDEYKEIKELYDQVVKNVVDLMSNCEINNPVEAFAIYVYMYRHGYLSYNMEYNYSTKMKDFSGLQGVDVIRGLGVCRSVASLYSDICSEMGMNSSVLVVDAKNAIPAIEKLCDKDKPIPDDKTKMFVKSVVAATKLTPIPNHMITTVEKDGINYVLDPMNDGFLHMKSNNKLVVANDSRAYMKLNLPMTAFNRLIHNTKIKSYKELKSQLSLPTIDYNEYKEIYLDILNYCQQNVDMFEEFYRCNQDLYEELYNKSYEQGGLISRSTGFHQAQKLLRKLEEEEFMNSRQK